jgi:nicotinate-nucleotide--dimethylbenzimidazole phosphoribosyltransferase
MTSDPINSNKLCSACAAAMPCGATAASCWCQDFASLNIDPARSDCLCEKCMRVALDQQRANARATLEPKIQTELAKKTMPTGALGALQQLSAKLASIQNTLKPSVVRCGVMVFAGDHGLADEGVSAYPKSVTWQMVMNFIGGGAAINVLAKANHLALQIVDAGVDHDFSGVPNLVNAKIADGTASSLRQPAMTALQFSQAWEQGGNVLTAFVKANSLDAVGFGEMGIGNTSAASLLLSLLLKIDIDLLIGRGTGVNDAQLIHKTSVLHKTLARISLATPKNPQAIAEQCGGFEIVMMASAMQKAADLGVVFVVDGFIATSAYALAHALNSQISFHAIFAHCSAEAGHRKALEALGATALLDLGLRLGEGSGAALAMPLLRSAALIMSDMATFESAAVADKV